MTIGQIYWILMLLIVVFGCWRGFSSEPAQRPFYFGGSALLFVLLFLIGWKLFGWPIHGDGERRAGSFESPYTVACNLSVQRNQIKLTYSTRMFRRTLAIGDWP